MESGGKTTLPHAGKPLKGNPAAGSDRVKAPVAGAGSTDCGGSQTSREEESRRVAAEVANEIELHKDLLKKLQDFAQPKINVHKDIKAMIANLVTGFARLRKELAKQSQRPEVAEGGTQTTPTLKQRQRGSNVESMEVEGTPKGRRMAVAKRKNERHTPQSTEQPRKKRQKEQRPQAEEPSMEPEGKVDGKWQKVGKKKKKPREKKAVQQPQKQLRAGKPRSRPTLPNAIVVQQKGTVTYAEILSHIRTDEALKEVSTAVQKVRRTNAGHLLFVLSRKGSERAAELREAMEGALQEKAEVRSKVQEIDVQIKDLDEVTTKEEVVQILQKDLGANGEVTLASVKSLRFAYDKTQTAVVRLSVPVARKLLELRTVRVGWTYCRVRECVRPLKCFKCWHFGHLSRECKSATDRSQCCIKCGEAGHKIATCTAAAKCALCLAKGENEPANHIAGSSRCPAYKRALQANARR